MSWKNTVNDSMSRTNFTSETIRLEPTDSVCATTRESGRTNNLHIQAAVLSASQGYQKKKVSSFQITSIRPTSRSSNDGADDSENDTEDTSDILDSSRVTFDLDQETPSFSEDYSKSEDLLGVGPVIPTNSQYGITALVQQTGAGGMMTARLPQGVTVNVTEGGLALAKADGEPDDLDNWQKRFKIVKIDSNKPLNKGRWVCLDFMDSPALNASEAKEEVPNLVVSNLVLADDGSAESQSFVQIPMAVSSLVQPSTPHKTNQPSQIASAPTQVQSCNQYNSSGGPAIQAVAHGYPTSSQGSALPPNSGHLTRTSTQHVQSTSEIIQSIPEVSAPSENLVSSSNIINSELPSSNISQPSTISHPQQLENNQQLDNIQGISLSQAANVNAKNMLNLQMVGNSSFPNQSTAQTTNHLQSLISQSMVVPETPHSTVAQNQPTATVVTTSQVSNANQVGNILSTNTSPGSSLINVNTGIQNTTNNICSGGTTSTSEINQMQHSNSNCGGLPGTVATHSHPSTLEGLPSAQQMEVLSSATPTNLVSEESESFCGLMKALSSVTTASATSSRSFTKYSPHVTPPTVTPPLTGMPLSVQDVPAAAAASVLQDKNPDFDSQHLSASNASAVAIDNRIEQAMDLVKSHLMMAVREEVDVLKDKIVELMDRINHLECENSMLRQYASPEVLQQIQAQLPHQIQQPSHHSSTS